MPLRETPGSGRRQKQCSGGLTVLSVVGEGQETLVILGVGGSGSSQWALGSGGDLVAPSCPTLCESVARQAPLSMWILQARILEWVAMPSSRDLPYPGMVPGSPALQADSLPTEPSGKLRFWTQAAAVPWPWRADEGGPGDPKGEGPPSEGMLGCRLWVGRSAQNMDACR